jgi:DNA replication protein DnaC
MAYEPQDAHLFFQLIYEMYDKAAFILTSNQGPGEWGKFIRDTTLTTAIFDRPLHRSEILTFNEGQDSIRMKYRKTLFNKQSVESYLMKTVDFYLLVTDDTNKLKTPS